MKRTIFITSIGILTASLGSTAPIFDFATTTRTFLSGPDSVPPDSGDFVGGAPFTETKFLVGNLMNGCGLYPKVDTVRSESGTGCGWTDLAQRIDYDTGADDFTLSEDTEGILEVIVKLGHPEEDATARERMQNQVEQFDILLVSSLGETLLAELLDDVSTEDFEEDNGYYRYVYDARTIPAGTYSPSFVSRDGSIEFLTVLRVRPDTSVPEPATLWLLAVGLGVASAARARRPRS